MDFEVVMVDNASKDVSLEFVKNRFPEVRIVPSETNLGFAGGNNLGLEHCRGEYVFLLNNDTRLEPRALENLAYAIFLHPQIHVFACFMLNFNNPELVDSAGDTLYTTGVTFSFRGFPVSNFLEERFVTSACAGAAVYTRELLEQLKGFDEDFFLLLEDVDLSLRAQHRGESILFLPSVKVFHKGSATLGGVQSPVSFYYVERNFLWLLLKNYPWPSLADTLPRYLVIKILRFFHAVRFRCVGKYFRANWDSLKGIKSMLGKRHVILGNSRISSRKFKSLLRRGWLKERIALFFGRQSGFSLPTKVHTKLER